MTSLLDEDRVPLAQAPPQPTRPQPVPSQQAPPRLSVAPGIALQRLRRLAEAGSLEVHSRERAVVVARGRVRGVLTQLFATDPAVRAGALSADDCARIAAALRAATRDGIPVVGIWHSAGALVQEGVAALDGMGSIFAAATGASGRIPHVALVLGTSAGGAAYGSALADVVVTGPDARLFVTGPSIVNEVTGEHVDAQSLGGPDVHARHSGLGHVTAASEDEAMQAVARLVRLLARPVGRSAPALPDVPALARALPERRRRTYDVRPLVELLLDANAGRVELLPEWAPNLVTVLGRLDGRTVGVLANNPARLCGCLDGRSADKGARFVRMCDALGVPIVTVVDVPGFLPGVEQEWDGVVRRGAKLLHAFAEASVPRVTLVTRKAYGGAYIAMGSRALGASTVLAWPTAEIAVMGPEAAARIVHRRTLDALPAQRRYEHLAALVDAEGRDGGLQQALDLGLVDRVVEPATTRRELARALSDIRQRRGRHTNIPL